jgi:hypothetical protein
MSSTSSSPIDFLSRGVAISVLLGLIFIVFWVFDGFDKPFLVSAIFGAVVVQAVYSGGVARALSAVALTVSLTALFVYAHKFHWTDLAGNLWALGGFLGLASLLVLAWDALRSTEAMKPLLLALFCPFLAVVTNLALSVQIGFLPLVRDSHLFLFDGSLGFQPSFAVGRLFQAAPLLRSGCLFVYSILPFVELLGFLVFLRSNRRMVVNPFIVFMLVGLIGMALFAVCPATGPVYAFKSFPHLPLVVPSAAAVPQQGAPRNAIPSLHTAWALLLWWNLRGQKQWISWSALVFLFFTLLATMGFGEHYFVDLVVAVPFSLMIQSLCLRDWVRAGFGASITMSWLLYLRFGMLEAAPAPVHAWAMVLVTLAVTAYVGIRSSLRSNVHFVAESSLVMARLASDTGRL